MCGDLLNICLSFPSTSRLLFCLRWSNVIRNLHDCCRVWSNFAWIWRGITCTKKWKRTLFPSSIGRSACLSFSFSLSVVLCWLTAMRMWWCFCCVPPFSLLLSKDTLLTASNEWYKTQERRRTGSERGRKKSNAHRQYVEKRGRQEIAIVRTYRHARDERERRCCPTLRLTRTTSLFIKHTNLPQLSSASFRGNRHRRVHQQQSLDVCRFQGDR